MSGILELNYWVVDEEISRVFPVKMPSTDAVGDLKEVIKGKEKHLFQDVDTGSLVLWKVNSFYSCKGP
jgi:Crinkler effector protein N-terminal domain